MWVMSPPNEAMTLCRLVVAFGALRSANSYATELRCRSFAVGDVIMRKAAVRSDDTYLRLTDATGAVGEVEPGRGREVFFGGSVPHGGREGNGGGAELAAAVERSNGHGG